MYKTIVRPLHQYGYCEKLLTHSSLLSLASWLFVSPAYLRLKLLLSPTPRLKLPPPQLQAVGATRHSKATDLQALGGLTKRPG